MKCKYCNEMDESKLLMRSTVIKSQVETITICTSCLWEKLTPTEAKNGKILPKKKSSRTRSSNLPAISENLYNLKGSGS